MQSNLTCTYKSLQARYLVHTLFNLIGYWFFLFLLGFRANFNLWFFPFFFKTLKKIVFYRKLSNNKSFIISVTDSQKQEMGNHKIKIQQCFFWKIIIASPSNYYHKMRFEKSIRYIYIPGWPGYLYMNLGYHLRNKKKISQSITVKLTQKLLLRVRKWYRITYARSQYYSGPVIESTEGVNDYWLFEWFGYCSSDSSSEKQRMPKRYICPDCGTRHISTFATVLLINDLRITEVFEQTESVKLDSKK